MLLAVFGAVAACCPSGALEAVSLAFPPVQLQQRRKPACSTVLHSVHAAGRGAVVDSCAALGLDSGWFMGTRGVTGDQIHADDVGSAGAAGVSERPAVSSTPWITLEIRVPALGFLCCSCGARAMIVDCSDAGQLAAAGLVNVANVANVAPLC